MAMAHFHLILSFFLFPSVLSQAPSPSDLAQLANKVAVDLHEEVYQSRNAPILKALDPSKLDFAEVKAKAVQKIQNLIDHPGTPSKTKKVLKEKQIRISQLTQDFLSDAFSVWKTQDRRADTMSIGYDPYGKQLSIAGNLRSRTLPPDFDPMELAVETLNKRKFQPPIGASEFGIGANPADAAAIRKVMTSESMMALTNNEGPSDIVILRPKDNPRVDAWFEIAREAHAEEVRKAVEKEFNPQGGNAADMDNQINSKLEERMKKYDADMEINRATYKEALYHSEVQQLQFVRDSDGIRKSTVFGVNKPLCEMCRDYVNWKTKPDNDLVIVDPLDQSLVRHQVTFEQQEGMAVTKKATTTNWAETSGVTAVRLEDLERRTGSNVGNKNNNYASNICSSPGKSRKRRGLQGSGCAFKPVDLDEKQPHISDIDEGSSSNKRHRPGETDIQKRPQKLSKVDPEVDESLVKKFQDFNLYREKLGPKVRDVDVVRASVGHGGKYASVQPVVSRKYVIESDHAPHFSILNYIDPNTPGLPPKLRDVLQNRAKLQADLPEKYHENSAEIKKLKVEMDTIDLQRPQHLPVSKWKDAEMQKQYYKNKMDITKINTEAKELLKKIETSTDPVAIADVKQKVAASNDAVNKLIESNRDLRAKAKADAGIVEQTGLKQKTFNEMHKRVEVLQAENSAWGKQLASYDAKVKGAMSVLSIPYGTHRNFPTTGFNGLDEDIVKLKKASAADAMTEMESRQKAFESNMKEGVKKGYIKQSDIARNPDNTVDVEKTWVKIGKKTSTAKSPPADSANIDRNYRQKEFFARLKKTHANYFMATAIYYAKTPTAGYDRLMSLYIKQYKVVIPDFDANYKAGAASWVKANQDFGFLSETEVKKISHDFGLNDQLKRVTVPDETTFKMVQGKIDEKADKIATQNEKKKQSIYTPFVCSSGGRTRRATGGDCIISFDKKTPAVIDEPDKAGKLTPGEGDIEGNWRPPIIDDGDQRAPRPPPDVDVNHKPGGESGVDVEQRLKTHLDIDGKSSTSKVPDGNTDQRPKILYDTDDIGHKPKIINPASSWQGATVDSKKLINLLNNPDTADVKTREAVIDFARQNKNSLVGTPEEVSAAKALLKRESLESTAKTKDLANEVASTAKHKTVRGGPEGHSSKPLSRYGKMKVSATKMSQKVEKFVGGSDKIGGAYGKIMLAKTVVTSLRHGDYTGLAIVGGKMSLDYGLAGVRKFGEHLVKKAAMKATSKLGGKLLGKITGPIGAIVDIGLNVWSITKSVNVLNDPNASKYDRNDAIADIVADSIDIAVTAAATVLSLVFPPLAPLFSAVAFVVNVVVTLVVGVFKAANHINRLNDQIPLLDYEKVNEVGRFLTLQDVSGYLQDLIDTKKANNIEVNRTVQFLKDNPDFIGKVAPSRTLYDPEAPCYLQSRTCHKVFFIQVKCSSWTDVVKCYGDNGYCPGYQQTCGHETGGYIPYGLFVYGNNKEYKCRCGDKPPPEWGHEILDSEVDFSRKRSVHLQRAAPDFLLPSGFYYMCKPSSETFEGDRVSRRDTENDYLCKGAYGVRRYSGKFMLYDLGNGTDSVKLNEDDPTNNVFIVKKGHKQFEGNAGEDTFHVDASCSDISGSLDGGGYTDQGNTLVLGDKCGGGVIVDFIQGVLTSPWRQLRIKNINRIIGQRGESEVVCASCSTKFISGGGGGDQIVLPSCPGGRENLVVLAEGTTTVETKAFDFGEVFIVVQKPVKFNLRARERLRTNGKLMVKFDEELSNVWMESGSSTVRMWFANGGEARLDFEKGSNQKRSWDSKCGQVDQPKNAPSIVLGGTDGTTKQLSYDIQSGSLTSVIPITKCDGLATRGYDFISNIFHITCKSTEVRLFGGSKDDRFILTEGWVIGSIDGGGGTNTLVLPPSNLEFVVNLNQGTTQGRLSVKSIQQISGNAKSSEHFIVGCETKLLIAGGSSQFADRVDIANQVVCSNPLTLQVQSGNVAIFQQTAKRDVTIHASFGGGCDNTNPMPPLDLTLSTINATLVTVAINHQSKHISSATLLPNSEFRLTFEGEHKLTTTANRHNHPTIRLQESNSLQSSVEVKNGTKVTISHFLSATGNNGDRYGARMVANIFHLAKGTWNVHGGNLDDTFVLQSIQDISGSFLDGKDGDNSLYLLPEISGRIETDLSSIPGKINNNLRVYNTDTIYGRAKDQDVVQISCRTKLLSLAGGSPGSPDIIRSPLNFRCSNSPFPTFVATGVTTLELSTFYGTAQIYVFPETDRSLIQTSMTLGLSNENTRYAVPIRRDAFSLKSYTFSLGPTDGVIQLRLELDGDNFLQLGTTERVGTNLNEEISMMFVDQDFNSQGNVIFNQAVGKIYVLHVLDDTAKSLNRMRRGAVGAANIFRIEAGNWDAKGGQQDDSFIVKTGTGSGGSLDGLGGIDTLVLDEGIKWSIDVNLNEGYMLFKETNTRLGLSGIEIIKGAPDRVEYITTGCHTKFITSEGGTSDVWDRIVIPYLYCTPQMDVFVSANTQVQNFAQRGNFSYHIQTTEDFTLVYPPASSTSAAQHLLNFSIPFQSVQRLVQVDSRDALNMTFETSSHILPFSPEKTKIYIHESPNLIAEIVTRAEGDIQAEIFVKEGHSGSVNRLNGVPNLFVIQSLNTLDTIHGGDMDDNFLLKSSFPRVTKLDGGEGVNKLSLLNGFYPQNHLLVDLNVGKVQIGTNSNPSVTLIEEMRKIQEFIGREHQTDEVVLGCDTKWVTKAEVILITNAVCKDGYRVKMEIGATTRVRFEVDDEVLELESGVEEGETVEEDIEEDAEGEILEPEGDESMENAVDEGSGDPMGEGAEDNSTDWDGVNTYRHVVLDADEDEEYIEEDEYSLPPPESVTILPPSSFHYHFTDVRSFDVEVDLWHRLWKTRHFFYLNLTVSQFTLMKFDPDSSRLVYQVGGSSLEYSHLLAPPLPEDLYYSTPQIFTKDGFLVRISRYGEIVLVYGNLEQTVELQTMVPAIAYFSVLLRVPFLIQTATDFLYSSVPGEIGVLENLPNTTSHLIGFNQTTYSIVSLDTDVFIYTQKNTGDTDDENRLQVVDLSEIITQIRNQTGTKYKPPVVEAEGGDFVLTMTGFEAQFPGRLTIVNSTGTGLRILLGSVAMTIEEQQASREKRSVEEVQYVLTPIPIEIPSGHTYLLSSEDMEDGQVIKDEDSLTQFSYTRDNDDLVVTNMVNQGNASESEDEPTILIISDYFIPPPPPEWSNSGSMGANSTSALSSFDGTLLAFNNASVRLLSNGTLLNMSNAEPLLQVEYYEDILEQAEETILQQHPEIQRIFQVPLTRKIMRDPILKQIFYVAVIILVTLSALLTWTLCRRKAAKGKYVIVGDPKESLNKPKLMPKITGLLKRKRKGPRRQSAVSLPLTMFVSSTDDSFRECRPTTKTDLKEEEPHLSYTYFDGTMKCICDCDDDSCCETRSTVSCQDY